MIKSITTFFYCQLVASPKSDFKKYATEITQVFKPFIKVSKSKQQYIFNPKKNFKNPQRNCSFTAYFYTP